MTDLTEQSGTLARWTAADQRRAEQDDLASPNPWVRSAAMAEVWLAGHKAGTKDQYRRTWTALMHYATAIEVAPLDMRLSDLDRWRTLLDQHGTDPLVARPLAPASVARHLAAVAGFYRRAVIEGVIDHAPTENLRRPVVDDESPQPYLDREQMQALLRAAAARGPRLSLLVRLMMVDYLRVSEALSARIEDIGEAEGHRFIRVKRKGGKVRRVSLPPMVWTAIDAVIGDRTEGPIIVTATGAPMSRVQAWREVRRLGQDAELPVAIGNHTLRHAAITRSLQIGIPLAQVQDGAGHERPETTVRYNRARGRLDNHPAGRLAADLADGLDTTPTETER